MTKPIKVSVLSITYNQEQYIRQMLDSVVSQKTNFRFELIVGDDHSTDRTPQIISEYSKNYPDIIRPILRKRNIGIQNNLVDLFMKSNGRYIALCEGDDFWTDDKKLQSQADLLDKDSNTTLCFHPVKVFFEHSQGKDSVFPDDSSNLTIHRLINENFIQTNSVMYRSTKDYSKLQRDVMPFDWYLNIFHARKGRIRYINKIMSSYRRHEMGVWWDSINDIEKLWIKNGLQQINMFVEVRRLITENNQDYKNIAGSIAYLLDNFLDIDKKYKTNLFESVIAKHPNVIREYARDQLITIRQLFNEREILKNQAVNLQNELQIIKNSRIWKIREKVMKLKKG